VALIVLILLRGRVNGRGMMIVTASCLTALWAANLSMAGLLPQTAATLLDNLRLSAWLIVLVVLVGMPAGRRRISLALLGAIAFSIVVIGYDLERQAQDDFGAAGLLHLGLGVAGLLAAENVWRNAENAQRRNLWPLCFALGTTFAFELFLYAEHLMVPNTGAGLAEGRGLIGIFAVPLLALAIARNREWRVDIHVSRTVVFHTAALVASGIFFLAMAAVGIVVRQLGGRWGPTLQALTLLGSAIVVVSVLGGQDVRTYLKRFISKHFYSHRFDYRAEWLRFVDTVSEPKRKNEDLAVRIVRALAQIVDSPAGMLWRARDGGGYFAEAGWNAELDASKSLPIDDPFIAGFQNGDHIQLLEGGDNRIPELNVSYARIAVPLMHNKVIIGFVVLRSSNAAYAPDDETIDLLRAAGTQAASYLAEERSTQALLDSRLLTEFSKRFAFVIHDIKNLAGQLDLILSNARRHLDNPEFREDMLHTLDNSVAKLNRLVRQLRTDSQGISLQSAEPDAVIAELVRERSKLGTQIESRLGAPDCTVAMKGDDLRSVLQHLINNASEAARAEGVVAIQSRCAGDKLIIEVSDDGPGMDEEFVRNELFRPFRSTKTAGLGIGAYQTRELIRMSGGDLDVISRKGIGTVMRMTLPVAKHLDLAPSAA
jgi:putative PEP-CTERM system histidine kinase